MVFMGFPVRNIWCSIEKNDLDDFNVLDVYNILNEQADVKRKNDF
jgi:hypothetical protein